MMNGEFLAYPLMFIIFCVLAIKLWEKTKELKEKNLRLIQFYLDRKFLHKIITTGLSLSYEGQFHFEIINKIKEYFQLEDVQALKYSALAENEDLNSLFKEKLTNIIMSHYKKKESMPDTSHLILDSVRIADNNYRLYIYFPNKKANRKNYESIIYVKTKCEFEHLSNDEMLTLDTSIHILKTSLFPNVG